MAKSPKIFARVFSCTTNGSAAGPALTVVIEWLWFGDAQRRSGKLSVNAVGPANESGLTADLKDALAIHLHTLYPAEAFKASDILGLGV